MSSCAGCGAWPGHEISPGLLTKILRDLGLTRRDLS
jgi:hypothetical protein